MIYTFSLLFLRDSRLDLRLKAPWSLLPQLIVCRSHHPAPLLYLLRYETARVLIRKYHENPQSSLHNRRLEVMGVRNNGCLRRPALSFSPITSKRLLRWLNLKGNWKFVIWVWFKKKIPLRGTGFNNKLSLGAKCLIGKEVGGKLPRIVLI